MTSLTSIPKKPCLVHKASKDSPWVSSMHSICALLPGSFRMMDADRKGFTSATVGCPTLVFSIQIHREIAGTLRMVPWLFNPPRSPSKGDIPYKYPLYQVYMGLIIKGTFSLWIINPGSHTIHGTGVFAYMCLIFMVHVGKYTTSPIYK